MLWCSQCTGRCLGPAVATQSRTVSCKHFSNSTSKTCDPKERCQTCYGIFSITYSHTQSSANVLFLIMWFSNTFQAVTREELLVRDVRRALEGVPVEDVHGGVRQWLPVPSCWMHPSPKQKNPPRPALRLATAAFNLATLQHHFLWQWVSFSPCYKPDRRYDSRNVCPRSPPLECSCFIRENISDLRAKYIGLFRHSPSQSYHNVPRELALVRRFFLSTVISGIQTSAFCSSLFCGET